MPVTTPFPFTKKKVAKELPTHMTTTTTTTIRPKSAKATPSWNRNTARPQTPAPPISYSNFQLGQLGQLDPALLHNGFLFDKVGVFAIQILICFLNEKVKFCILFF